MSRASEVHRVALPPDKGERLNLLQSDYQLSRQRFKSLLKQEDVRVTSPNLHYARAELRNAYLKLLFHFTFSGRSNSAVVNLWTETTIPLVQLYRSQLAMLETAIKSPNDAAQAASGSNQKKKGAGQPLQQKKAQLAQAYIKQAAAFRSFLVAEENFWCDLVARLARLYDVQEAFPHLRALSILTKSFQVPPPRDDLETTGMDRIVGSEGLHAEEVAQAQLPANRQRLLEIIHKTLVYCGDLARYQELYREGAPGLNEVDTTRSGGALRGGPRGSDRGGRGRGRGRGGRGGGSAINAAPPPTPFLSSSQAQRTGKFERAEQCYYQACRLVPTQGDAWNQLAVLSLYRNEPLLTLYRLYRSLCAIEPFNNTKENMDKTLLKALRRWQERGEAERYLKPDALAGDHFVREQTVDSEDALKDLTVLHAIFYTRDQALLASRFPQRCVRTFSLLLQRKALQTDAVVQVIVTSISALWVRRLWRDTAPNEEKVGVASSIVTEQGILLHLCGLFRALLDLASKETAEAIAHIKEHPPTGPRGVDAADEAQSQRAAQHITAVMRRMLPAIRIASKWLKIHLGYVQRARQESKQRGKVTSTSQKDSHARLSREIDLFWVSYVDFINVIRFAFPFDTLPSLGMSVGQSGMTGLDFEEDRDMHGFSPMRKSTLAQTPPYKEGLRGESSAPTTSALHPNEEHLIRIADIIIDAKVIAETDSSPIGFDDAKNSFHADVAIPSQPEAVTRSPAKSNDDQVFHKLSIDDADGWQNESESSDDAVDLAMRAVDERRVYEWTDENDSDGHAQKFAEVADDGDDDDDDDEIILIPAALQSKSAPGGMKKASVTTVSNVQQVPTSKLTDNNDLHMSQHEVDTTHQRQNSKQTSLTAQHLFLQVLNGSPSTSKALASATSDPSMNAQGSAGGFNGRPGSASVAQTSFGAIGSPLARGTPSPLSSGHAYNAASPAAAGSPWATTGDWKQHRADIWAPLPHSAPSGASLVSHNANPTQHHPQQNPFDTNWPSSRNIAQASSGASTPEWNAAPQVNSAAAHDRHKGGSTRSARW